MAVNNRTIIVIIVVIIVLVILWLIVSNNKTTAPYFENFDQDAPKMLDRYYTGGSLKGLQPYLVDQMPCSPSCCGTSWDIPFDGLNENQVQAALTLNAASINSGGNFVRNNLTCGIGSSGVGCPCITPEAANFIGNRGGNTAGVNVVDPSFLLAGPQSEQEVIVTEDVFTNHVPPSNNAVTNGYYVPNRDLSHLNPGVNIQDLSNLQAYGATLPVDSNFNSRK